MVCVVDEGGYEENVVVNNVLSGKNDALIFGFESDSPFRHSWIVLAYLLHYEKMLFYVAIVAEEQENDGH